MDSTPFKPPEGLNKFFDDLFGEVTAAKTEEILVILPDHTTQSFKKWEGHVYIKLGKYEGILHGGSDSSMRTWMLDGSQSKPVIRKEVQNFLGDVFQPCAPFGWANHGKYSMRNEMFGGPVGHTALALIQLYCLVWIIANGIDDVAVPIPDLGHLMAAIQMLSNTPEVQNLSDRHWTWDSNTSREAFHVLGINVNIQATTKDYNKEGNASNRAMDASQAPTTFTAMPYDTIGHMFMRPHKIRTRVVQGHKQDDKKTNMAAKDKQKQLTPIEDAETPQLDLDDDTVVESGELDSASHVVNHGREHQRTDAEVAAASEASSIGEDPLEQLRNQIGSKLFANLPDPEDATFEPQNLKRDCLPFRLHVATYSHRHRSKKGWDVWAYLKAKPDHHGTLLLMLEASGPTETKPTAFSRLTNVLKTNDIVSAEWFRSARIDEEFRAVAKYLFFVEARQKYPEYQSQVLTITDTFVMHIKKLCEHIDFVVSSESEGQGHDLNNAREPTIAAVENHLGDLLTEAGMPPLEDELPDADSSEDELPVRRSRLRPQRQIETSPNAAVERPPGSREVSTARRRRIRNGRGEIVGKARTVAPHSRSTREKHEILSLLKGAINKYQGHKRRLSKLSRADVRDGRKVIAHSSKAKRRGKKALVSADAVGRIIVDFGNLYLELEDCQE